MYDLSVPNDKPGTCAKCHGTGEYRWGTVVNGRVSNVGTCNACRGTGAQTWRDIYRNRAFNKHRIAQLASV
jgi:DnaJ-class molecular chaperone